MTQLDENYLQLIRNHIYNATDSKKTEYNNASSGRKKRAKKNSGTHIKDSNRVGTQERRHIAFLKPEKSLVKVQTSKNEPIASFQTEKISPNVNGLNPTRTGKKNKLSVSDSDVIIKRKKNNSTEGKVSQVNQNLGYNATVSRQKLTKKKKKNAKKLNNFEFTENKSSNIFTPSLQSPILVNNFKVTNIESEGFKCEAKIINDVEDKEFNHEHRVKKLQSIGTINKSTPNVANVKRFKRKHSGKKKSNNTSQNNPSSIEHAVDFYDDNSILVKGLKFQRFNMLFHSIQNNSNNNFTLNAKYYKTSEEDNIQWNMDNNEKQSTDIDEQEVVSKTDVNEIFENKQNNETDSFNNSNDDSVLNCNEKNDEIDNSLININLKNGCRIIVLQHLNQTVHFNGLCYLGVLNGEVNILGASLNNHSEDQKIYSPRGTSLLYIRNESRLHKNNDVALRNLISKDLLNKNDLKLSFKEHSAILLCKALKEQYIEFIESHVAQKIFPEKIFAGPRIDFELAGNWNKIRDAELWNDILGKVSQISKFVICGGKGVGKSTFLRYAVNVLLKKFNKIRIVELDPGQSEFHPPGCISVATVDKNVLGPNYTHLQTADRVILSHINIGYNVAHYLKSIQYLMKSVEPMENLPTLINFPGFTQDLGLDIAANTLKLLAPTLVIEIKSNINSRNYRIDMTADNVNNFLGASEISKYQYITHNMPVLKYSYEKIDSLSVKNKAWTLEARQARELCVLSYFGKMILDGLYLGSASNMFSINISSLIIANVDGKALSPMTVNANLVALCSLAHKESKIFVAYGYGFVRGIDIEKDILVLLTPEPIETLKNVTHLILSSVTTPPSLILAANGVEGHVPYVGVGDLVDFGQFTKRSYLPPIHKIIDNKKV